MNIGFNAFGKRFMLKGPRVVPLFSERYRQGVRVIPLGFGWRITIRELSHDRY